MFKDDHKLIASVIIPCKNAGGNLRNVLNAVVSQNLPNGDFEVILIDSGSKDCTLQIINEFTAKYSCIKLFEIAPADFGHGKTRNFGASLSNADYLVFITQDALPINNEWLYYLLKPFELHPDVVGVFGKHLPYPDCNIFEKRNLLQHFNNFGEGVIVYHMEDAERYKTDEGYRHLLGFYSDNNSAMRRSTWLSYPYLDVNFAEDQLWAKQMIELGFKKAYSSQSCVYHSHNYTHLDCFKRSFDDHCGLYRIYAYKPIQSVFQLLKMSICLSINDFKYLKSLHNIKFLEKLKLSTFILIQNTMKQLGAYIAYIKQGNNESILSRETKLRK